LSIDWENVEFKEEKRFLSNMYPCKVVIDGKIYNSSENYYQSSKFITTNPKLSILLSECDQHKSKSLANNYKKQIREDWNDVKLQVMFRGLIAKFSQHSNLRLKLLDTGDDHLEERNDWNDTFWGTYKGEGQNNLGKMLMKIRDFFREFEPTKSFDVNEF